MASQTEQFNIRWNNYTSVLQSIFRKLLEGEQFVDVTLTCEGRSIKCHRVILSACSTYFEKILTENSYSHLVILLKDMKFWELEALVTFMYNGEVSVNQKRLSSLVKAAQSLKIKGLAPDSSFSPSDSEKIDDDDIEEEYQIGNLGKVESEIDHPNLQYSNDNSILRENFYGASTKPCVKRKIVAAPPKLIKMPKIETKTKAAKNSSTLSSPLSILSPEVVMSSGSGRQQHDNKRESVIPTHVIASDEEDDAVDENQECEIIDEVMNEDSGSDAEHNDDVASAHEERVNNNSGGDGNTLAEPTVIQDFTKGTTRTVRRYTKETRDSALAVIASGVSMRQCSETFGIPRKTLSKWKSREARSEREVELACSKISVKKLKVGLQGCGSSIATKKACSKSSPLLVDPVGISAATTSTSDAENKGVSLPPGLHPKKIRMIRKHRVEILSEAALCILKGNTFQHVSEVYDVPKTTLRDFMVRRGLLQRGPPRKAGSGPSSLNNTTSPPSSVKGELLGHDSNGETIHDSDVI